MIVFTTLVTLFIIGSLFGWILEVFFRRLFSAKKWINPGFLVGPYLPIYGFGTMILYGLSNIYLPIDITLAIIIKILLIGVCLTLIEFIAGLIFTKLLKIKLWDYSNQKGNIMGLICPLFSFFWLLIGCAYYFGINPYLVKLIEWLTSLEHNIYFFFVGIIFGMIFVDFLYSIHFATKLKIAMNQFKISVDFEKFKDNVSDKTIELKQKQENIKAKLKKPFFFPFKDNAQSMQERIKDYINSDAYDYIQRQKDIKMQNKQRIKQENKNKIKRD